MTNKEFTDKLAEECNKILRELKKVNPKLTLQELNKSLFKIPAVRNDVNVIVNNKNELTLISFFATIGMNTTGKALAVEVSQEGELLCFFSDNPTILNS